MPPVFTQNFQSMLLSACPMNVSAIVYETITLYGPAFQQSLTKPSGSNGQPNPHLQGITSKDSVCACSFFVRHY